MEDAALAMRVHDLDEHLSHIGCEHHKQDHDHDCVYHFDRVLGEWPRSQSGKSASGELLAIDILVVPGAVDETERIAGVIGQPVVGSIRTIVIRIVERDINADEHTRAVVAYHQHITE